MMQKSLKFQSKVECKIGGEQRNFHSNEIVVSFTKSPQKQIERKSIPYRKSEVLNKKCKSRYSNLRNLLLAMLLKIFK